MYILSLCGNQAPVDFVLKRSCSSLDEFYPYFEFIGVQGSAPYERFMHNFCNASPFPFSLSLTPVPNAATKTQGDTRSKGRLINTLRAVLHRKTHESRIFAQPIVKLPNVVEKSVELEFCEAEKLLYDKIIEVYIKSINGKSGKATVHQGRKRESIRPQFSLVSKVMLLMGP